MSDSEGKKMIDGPPLDPNDPRPYKCQHCGNGYKYTSGRADHIRKKHPETFHALPGNTGAGTGESSASASTSTVPGTAAHANPFHAPVQWLEQHLHMGETPASARGGVGASSGGSSGDQSQRTHDAGHGQRTDVHGVAAQEKPKAPGGKNIFS
ncbi:MAG: hypothetical protein Q9162_004862 [Coniocarpon cinnabarinum]